MGPAVMRDLVSRRMDAPAGVGKALDGVAWNEPGAGDLVTAKQLDDPLRGHHAELATRDRRRRREAAGDESRERVEIEAEAGSVGAHGVLLRGQASDPTAAARGSKTMKSQS